MVKMKEGKRLLQYLQFLLLLVYVVLICMVSLTDVSFFSILKVRDIGHLTFILVDILFVIHLIDTKVTSKKKKIFCLIYACLATAVYMMYCDDLLMKTVPGTVDDALKITGILCILFVFSGKE